MVHARLGSAALSAALAGVGCGADHGLRASVGHGKEAVVSSDSANVGRVGPRELRALIDGDGELAVLDVREEGVFSRGHLFRACSAPLSTLELTVPRVVPRKATPIVLCDDDESLAQRAATLLRRFGYTDLAILAGGVGAWGEAGFEVFTGVNVPSKAFGEFIEHRDGTPSISPQELKRRVDAGADLVILDSRPIDEYHLMNIPGGLDCPGAELVYRVHEVVAKPTTAVIVNCAGRTRSIIGAQSLINARIPNPVVALRNGTMGWQLAGFQLEHGNSRMAPTPSAPALKQAQAAAAAVAKRFGVARIDTVELARFRAEMATRSLYLLDVRDPQEYEAGTLPGFLNAPGGQLVQATDAYVATRGARIVLMDTDGVRAIMTASWLRQMGWRDVFVHDGVERNTLRLPEPPAPLRVASESRTIEAPALHEQLAAGSTSVIDLGTSIAFRKGHIPGALWAIRSRFDRALTQAALGQCIVFVAPDQRLAHLAAVDAGKLFPDRDIRVLTGGTHAWRAAGYVLEQGEAGMLDAPDDVWYRPYERLQGGQDAMREYLSWELELVAQIEREGVRYPSFPALR